MKTHPPFVITPEILGLTQKISWILGNISGSKKDLQSVVLRRINGIRTIHASLAIEGNGLNVEQLTALFEGKRVLGPKRDIEEAKNALSVYARLSKLSALSMKHFLEAHRTMMKGLIKDNGEFRSGNVGIFNGRDVVHMAQPAKRVPQLMEELFEFIATNNDLPWLIRACIFHYELKFIHPFSDGNGRMGRLWQQVLLLKENKIFETVPVETLIKENQKEYYSVLGECDKEGESTKFIVFSLKQIQSALENFLNDNSRTSVRDAKSRLEYARLSSHDWFDRKDYLRLHSDISSATASRDLLYGIKNGVLEKKGQINQAKYRFI